MLAAALALAVPASAGPPGGFLELLGRWHVVVVHFPVALLLAALLAEALLSVRPAWSLEDAGQYCLLLGAGLAVLAAGLGWLAVGPLPPAAGEPLLLRWHRWLGVASAGLAVLAAAAGRTSGRAGSRTLPRVLLLVAAVATAVVGHLGTLLVHGSDHFG